MIKIYNDRLKKSYNGYKYHNIFYFKRRESFKIAEDFLEDLVFASYDTSHDSFDFCVNQFQSGDCLEFKYKGEIIQADGDTFLAYPIGCNGALGAWSVVSEQKYNPNQVIIDKMIEMQKAYDKAVYKEFNCSFDEEKCLLAMIDELGEFNHEIKSLWCYWKKTQSPIDKDKALEELVDIWHFALSLSYHQRTNVEFTDEIEDIQYPLSGLYSYLIDDDMYRLEILNEIGKRFGFELKDVYEAYKKKNKVNYQRLASGY